MRRATLETDAEVVGVRRSRSIRVTFARFPRWRPPSATQWIKLHFCSVTKLEKSRCFKPVTIRFEIFWRSRPHSSVRDAGAGSRARERDRHESHVARTPPSEDRRPVTRRRCGLYGGSSRWRRG